MTDTPEPHDADRRTLPEGGLDVTSLDLGGDVVFVTDREGTIVDVNDAFVRVTGYSRNEAIGSKPSLLKSGLQDDDFYADMWRTITSGQVWEGQLVDRRRDGALRSHRVTITPVRDSSGRVTHFVAVERDVSGDLARQAPGGSVGLAHTDATAHCIYADTQAASLLRSQVNDLLGDGLLRLLEPEDARELREVVGMAAQSAREHHLDVRTGQDRWLSVEVAPLAVASGTVIGARLSLEDVTQRMHIHRELSRRDAFLGSVIDAIDDPIAVVDADGSVLTTNVAWRRQSAESPDDPLLSARVGDDLLQRFRGKAATGDDRAETLAEDLRRVLNGGSRQRRAESGVQITQLAWDEGGAVVRISAPTGDRSAGGTTAP